MPKNSLNVSLKGADDIFSTEESRQEQQREQVQQIPIGELFPFKNHPFKVLDDESMQRTVDVLKTLVVALGAGLGVWGAVNLMEGYGGDNPSAKSQGMKQLMAGGGVALIGITLVPLLSGLFG